MPVLMAQLIAFHQPTKGAGGGGGYLGGSI